MATLRKNYYRALKVDPSADQEDIKAAYHRLAQKYHPDKNSSPDATQHMQEITEAYEILRDPVKRTQYDSDNWDLRVKEAERNISGVLQPSIKSKKPKPKKEIRPQPNASTPEPFIAAVLSFVFLGGGGQIYLGQIAKGVILIIVSLVLDFFFLVGFIVVLFGCIDAFFLAKKVRNGEAIGKWQFFWDK